MGPLGATITSAFLFLLCLWHPSYFNRRAGDKFGFKETTTWIVVFLPIVLATYLILIDGLTLLTIPFAETVVDWAKWSSLIYIGGNTIIRTIKEGMSVRYGSLEIKRDQKEKGEK